MSGTNLTDPPGDLTDEELDAFDDADEQDLLADIPDELRFDLDTRLEPEQQEESDRIRLALGGQLVYAHRPKEYTMLALASAMSGMADGPDRAYAIMMWTHDVFDSPGRHMVAQMDSEDLYKLIMTLSEKWGQDTSRWNRGNRAERRAAGRSRSPQGRTSRRR